MSVDLAKDIHEILKSAVNDDIENFEIALLDGKRTGDGFLGEMTFVTLTNKKTGENLELVVKKVLPSTAEETINFMHACYSNEINFYAKIWPKLDDFQKTYPEAEHISAAPKSYATCLEIQNEKLVMENLKAHNYKLHPKEKPLNFKMYEKIFDLFGKIHGLSFAFKHHNPEKYSELDASLSNNWKKLVTTGFSNTITDVLGYIKALFDKEGNDKLAEKFSQYIENCVEKFLDSTEYNGQNSIIVHGDCWSNNMMFKLNDSDEIKDIKMLDYQMCHRGTPVFDLSYTLYSGADQESLDKWEVLLKVYHKSLTKNLIQFDCDPERIYSYKTMMQEWKEYNTFGFILGLLIWSHKSLPDTGDIKINEEFDNLAKGVKKDDEIKIPPSLDEKFLTERVTALVEHVYENGLL